MAYMRFAPLCTGLAVATLAGCASPGARSAPDPAGRPSRSSVPAALPQVLTDCEHFSRFPSEIGVACGDGNYQLVDALYDGWTGERALGHAVAVTNTCRPSCADGTFVRTPVDFRLDTTLLVYGVMLFTRLTVIDPISGKAVLTTPLLPVDCTVTPPSCPPTPSP